jgi:hypothetical protein
MLSNAMMVIRRGGAPSPLASVSANLSGLAIDGNDTIYAADSESTPRSHPGWLKGIRIGSLKDGKVTTFVPPHKTDSPDGAMGEGIAIDAAGTYTPPKQQSGA